jgi:ribonuclease P protein subunit RPR2
MIKRQKRLEKRIASERIKILLDKAKITMSDDHKLARRYIELATKISERCRVRIPKELKLAFCKKCLFPYRSDMCRVRIRKSRVVITCLNCGFVRRIPIRPKRTKS